MGIVVQQMVPADSAGVLFTSHPSNGDPRQMLITANFGLGEVCIYSPDKKAKPCMA
jgi:pyruvate,water dikinase